MKLFPLVVALSMLFPSAAWAQNDWPMVGKDPQHTGSVVEGPSPPFKRSWFAQSGDPDDSFTTWPIISEGEVVVTSGGGFLAVRASDGQRIWWHESRGGVTHVALVTDGERILAPLSLGVLVAIDQSQTELWRFQAKDSIDASGTLADGLLYFGSAEAKTFYALDAATGALKWEVQTELEPSYVPAVSEGVVVTPTESIGTDQSIIYAFEAATGKEIWRFETRDEGNSPAILDNKVIVAGGDFFLYALDLKTGREVWKAEVEAKFGPRNMPALAFGDVFLVDRVGNMYRFDGNSGRRKWFISTDETVGTFDQSSPVIAGKTLFIGSGSGDLYAVDVDAGKIVWHDAVQGIVLSGAADSERFYFGVKFGQEGLYAYEHDPEGQLLPDDPGGDPFTDLIYGLLLLAMILGGVLLVARIRRSRSS